MKIFTATAFAVSLFASVTVHAEERETVTVTIRHSDLDLRRADHRAQLDARVRRAAMIACGTVTNDLRHNDDIARCRHEMTADAAVKVAALSPSRVELASNR